MIELIPAIDIIGGKCVRLTQGEYDSKKIYNEQPLEVALEFEANGLKRLHMVDLDGAKNSHIVNYRVLDRIASRTSMTIDFGGGIKAEDDIKMAFDYGADMVTLGSVAVKKPELFADWLQRYGAEKIILGADARNGMVSVSGWKEDSSEELIPFLKTKCSQGINKVLCTDITRDGMLGGPSVSLYQEVMSNFPEMYLIASGGVGSIDDIYELNEKGIPAVVFGKAIYEGRIKLTDLKDFIV